MKKRVPLIGFAVAGAAWVATAAVFVRPMSASGGRAPAPAAQAFDTSLLWNTLGFDCDPAQLQGAARLICQAKRLEEGRRLFDEETFGGNGRTCVTCHAFTSGTFSPEDAQQRLAANPDDPLFLGDGLDDGTQGTTRITEHATVRIEIPLTARVRLANDPAATSVTFLRGTPTTRNTPALQPVFMYDGRDPTLEKQALGAIRAHAQNTIEPTPLQLQLLAEFQRTAPRFFSSLSLLLAARGGPPPRLPNGITASQRRGRAMFDDVPVTPGSTRGLCAGCHSGPMLDVANEFNLFGAPPGSRFFGVGVSERNTLNLPTHEFLLDGADTFVSPDIGMILTEPLPAEFPPGIPLIFLVNLFKTPTAWGVRHTAPYFHDNSAKTLEAVAEQYTFFFRQLGILLTPQDEADMVAFLKLL
jgi:cytochrome c peroxidase